jgi:pimeloyl-ACP methyl ester carboxylesterase
MLGINEPFILMGHSMGALIAKRYTLQHENNVKQLVLLHLPLYLNTQQVRETLRGTSHLYRFLLDSRYRNFAWPILRFALMGRMRHTKWSRERSLQNVLEKAEGFKDLGQLKLKTLLFVRLRDRPEYIENLKLFTLADSVTISLTDVTHNSPMQNPRYVKRAILKFLVNQVL